MGLAALLLAACGGGTSATVTSTLPDVLGPVPANAIQGRVVNVSFTDIAGATVTLSGGPTSGTTQTDGRGQFRFTALTAGSYTVTISKTGYQTLEYNSVDVTDLSGADIGYATMVIVLTAGQLQVVLTWGADPYDLDFHACTPDFHEINFYNKSDIQAPELTLDVDDTDSYGPETMTFTNFQSGTYWFWVEDFTNSPEPAFSNSSAHVQVQSSTGPVASYDIPLTQTAGQYWWKVFKIDQNQSITDVNQLTSTDPSATCSSMSPPFSLHKRSKPAK